MSHANQSIFANENDEAKMLFFNVIARAKLYET